MRLALPGAALLASITLVVACVGGPGSVDQGGENGDQYGGVRQDTGSSSRSSDDTKTPTSTSSGGGASSTSSSTSTSGSPPPVAKPKDFKASDYDQKCEKDSDCQPIYEGDACATCTCPNAVIGPKDSDKHTRDQIAAVGPCALLAGSSSSGAVCAPCASPQPKCDASKRCTL